MAEQVELIQKLQADEKARRRDLPDLVFFMLATGVRIGEALAVVWSQVDFEAGTVQSTARWCGHERGAAPEGHQESSGRADSSSP